MAERRGGALQHGDARRFSSLSLRAFSSGRIANDAEKPEAITMLKRFPTPFGHTLGRTTGWVHRPSWRVTA